MNYNTTEIPGFDNLAPDQQKRFTGIFERYMSAKGTDVQNDIYIGFVGPHGRCFEISTRLWGQKGYAILDPVNNTWY
ncbi:MAG: hypothetical protein KAT48_14160 [Bacteroidales bacterium]|nr:hypothetical protein [Bacteroidales bacterium]